MLTALSILIAVVGHDLLHLVQRWLTYVLIVAFAITTVIATTLPAAPAVAATPGFDLTAFLVQFSLAAGYNISYAVYVSDYSRYLPANSSAPKLIFCTYLGAAGLGDLADGAGVAAGQPAARGRRGRVDQAGRRRAVPRVRHDRGVVSAVALISIMGVNAYGAMLTGLSGIDAFRRVRGTQTPRVVGLTVVGVLTVVIALLIPADYLGSFNNFVLFMLYFLVPWTAVNLVDFYAVRHGKYAITRSSTPTASTGGGPGAG